VSASGSREIVAAHDLDDEGTRVRDGEPISLRGVLLKMIAEYARHNGHADLLREGIDGATGLLTATWTTARRTAG
jgi:hypothetical protein